MTNDVSKALTFLECDLLALVLLNYCITGTCKGCVFENNCPGINCERLKSGWIEFLNNKEKRNDD